MRSWPPRFAALLWLLGTATGCVNDSCLCTPSCAAGLVTVGLILDSSGCSSQCLTKFCVGGCSSDGKVCEGLTVPDGGIASCVASRLTASQGQLACTGPACVGVAVSGPDRLWLSSSATLACDVARDAGTSLGPAAAAIAIDFPPAFVGTLSVTPAAPLATLTLRGDAGLTRSPATSGTVDLTLAQPGGGVMGTYSLQFGSDTEVGSFTAPACDVCLPAP